MTDVDDIRRLPAGFELQADVCIIGSGPAGSTVARELGERGVSVVILESGGHTRSDATEALNEIVSVGHPRVLDQRLLRARTLGGTSSIWSGRAATFDENDFAQRSWVPHSGWPLDRASIAPYFARSTRHLGISVPDNRADGFLSALGLTHPVGERTQLQPYAWTYSRHPGRSGAFIHSGAYLREDPVANVRCFLNATVTQLELDDGGSSLAGVEVVGPDHKIRHVRARMTVLAAGGIENARLLLASNRRNRHGVGNESDQVGRYLMDHPRGEVARFAPGDHRRIQREFASHRVRVNGSAVVATPGVALTDRVQREEGLLNAAAWVSGAVSPNDAIVALRRLARFDAPQENLARFARDAPHLVSAAPRLLQRRSPERTVETLGLQVIVEQAPDPSSRVTLDSKTDSLGMPISRIDWRVGDLEARTVARITELTRAALGNAGLPTPAVDASIFDSDGGLRLPDVAHPTGTTRMSTTSRTGVVDADCKVFGVNNLFIAGSSVFPTSGHANPTQMIVALAVRLADHIHAGLASVRVPIAAPSVLAPSPTPPAPARSARSAGRGAVLVTGATSAVGRETVRQLIAAGFTVRALTSRAVRTSDDDIEWIVQDSREDELDVSPLVTGAIAVVSLAAAHDDDVDMERVNVDFVRRLAIAAAKAGVAAFCHVSSVSVYGSPRSRTVREDTPTLTADRDERTEYWGDDALRGYGRTKLRGERALRAALKGVPTVVFRPGVLVSDADLAREAEVGAARHTASAHRRTHHVHVVDAAAAFVWAIERGIDRTPEAVEFETFNLVDFSDDAPTFARARATMWRGIGTSGHRALPGFAAVDFAKDLVRYGRRGRPRWPLGFLRFDTSALEYAGFRPTLGMMAARERVIARAHDLGRQR